MALYHTAATARARIWTHNIFLFFGKKLRLGSWSQHTAWTVTHLQKKRGSNTHHLSMMLPPTYRGKGSFALEEPATKARLGLGNWF